MGSARLLFICAVGDICLAGNAWRPALNAIWAAVKIILNLALFLSAAIVATFYIVKSVSALPTLQTIP